MENYTYKCTETTIWIAHCSTRTVRFIRSLYSKAYSTDCIYHTFTTTFVPVRTYEYEYCTYSVLLVDCGGGKNVRI